MLPAMDEQLENRAGVIMDDGEHIGRPLSGHQ
jgi:hypothetical protein